MKRHVLILDKKDVLFLAAIRTLPGIEVAENGETIWVRDRPSDEILKPGMRMLPALNHYLADEENRLFPEKGLTPVAIMPELSWVTIKDMLPISLPVPALPGHLNKKVSIELIPSSGSKEPAALLTNLYTWKKYGEYAPTVLLKNLEFAASESGEVMLLGKTLPPLPGKTFWMNKDILIQSGYDFNPPILASIIAEKLNQTRGAILVFDNKGQWQKIDKTLFVRATRSGIRLTTANLKKKEDAE